MGLGSRLGLKVGRAHGLTVGESTSWVNCIGAVAFGQRHTFGFAVVVELTVASRHNEQLAYASTYDDREQK